MEKKISKQKKYFVFSATNYVFPFYRSFLLVKGFLKTVIYIQHKSRFPKFKKILCDAAQFYWAHKNTWRNDKISVFSSRSNIIKIPSTRYHDIDTTEDWNRAELFYKVLKKENKI